MNADARELRNRLAENINYEGEMFRIMAFRYEQDYEEGQCVKLGQCWSCDSGSYDTDSKFGKVKYAFFCKNGKGHRIDYSKLTEDEKYVLGCEDCESENEIVVNSEQLFKITYISTEEDFEQMGFYSVDVEML